MKTTKKLSTKDSARRDVCERLEALTDGAVTIQFCPDDFYGNDPDAKGHLFTGWLAAHLDNDMLDLDDRKDIDGQLVDQLWAVSSFYEDLAKSTLERMEAENTGRVWEHKRTVVMA